MADECTVPISSSVALVTGYWLLFSQESGRAMEVFPAHEGKDLTKFLRLACMISPILHVWLMNRLGEMTHWIVI